MKDITVADIKALGPSLAKDVENRVPLYRGMAAVLRKNQQGVTAIAGFWRSVIASEEARETVHDKIIARCQLNLLEALVAQDGQVEDQEEVQGLVEQLRNVPEDYLSSIRLNTVLEMLAQSSEETVGAD